MKKKKAASIELTKFMLPHKRKEQFKDCYKMRFKLIFGLGLFLLLWFLPVVIYSVIMDLVYSNIIITYVDEELTATLYLWNLIFQGGMIIFSFPVILGLSGSLRVLRTLVWGEGVYFFKDFFEGIKQSFKFDIIAWLFFALIYGIAFYTNSLFSNSFISFLPLLIISFLFLPILMWGLMIANTYSSTFKEYANNMMFFYIKTFPSSLLMSLVLLLPVTLSMFPTNFLVIKYVITILVILFYYPATLLGMSLLSSYSFDEVINKENYPEYYRKGLF